MLAFTRRIEIVKAYVSNRRDWIADDGIVNTLLWGELYRNAVPESVRTENPLAGNATRKRLVQRELRRRLRGLLDGGRPVSGVDRPEIPEHMRDDFTVMVAEMRDPNAGECSCGFPEQPCLRIMLRNGPPFPARPCEPTS